MKVLLDTTSGDAPAEEIIKGALEALNSNQSGSLDIVLTGDRDSNKKLLGQLGGDPARFSFIHAPQLISMEDSPVAAVKNNPQSSLVQGCKALKTDGDVFVTPGNTGAVVAASLLELGRVEGVSRPGLAAVLPTVSGDQVVVVDVGATPDSTATNLLQFALMGSVFAELILSKSEPTVGLLNIGEEKAKGSKLTKEAAPLLEEIVFPYAGNVEPHQILVDPPVDVVVCEGFVGNVLLKAFEGGASGTIKFFQKALSQDLRTRLGGFLIGPAVDNIKDELSFSRLGAVPLLGVKGTVFVGHGRSEARAIQNAILYSQAAVQWDLPGRIHEAIEQFEVIKSGNE